MAAIADFDKLCVATKDLLSTDHFGLLTDVDGTISRIASTPDGAVVSSLCRQSLQMLADYPVTVAVISGRSAEDAFRMVQLKNVIYFGNHGLERFENGRLHLVAGADDYPLRLMALMRELEESLPFSGLIFENKSVTAAIHYRLAEDPVLTRKAILETIGNLPGSQGLKVSEGKMVVELRPPLEINKGVALASLVESKALKSVIFLGDDSTDVDAVMMLKCLRSSGRCKGLGIAVVSEGTPKSLSESADFDLEGVDEVEKYLQWLTQQIPKR